MKPVIYSFEEIDSTMNYAKELAEKGCGHFTVVAAERQKSGRGRLSRAWLSETGGLYFTLILKPVMSADKAFLYNFAASLTMADTLNKLFKIEAQLKWPNDILVNGKKLCGMLSEIKTDGDMLSFINIGIGLNVNNDSLPQEINAVSIKELVGKEVSTKDILNAFLNNFDKRICQEEFKNVISDWKQKSITIGKQVRIVTLNAVSEGAAIDIDDNGALLLLLADGSIKKIIYGDCFNMKDPA